MTGRHEGKVLVSDVWLADQVDAWNAEFDAESDQFMAATRDTSALTTDQLRLVLDEHGRRKMELLCKARQLLGEVGRRG